MVQDFIYKVRSSKSAKVVERHWLTIAFLLGFIIDNITLNQVDQLFDNLVLLGYVLLAMFALLILYAGTAGKLGYTYSPMAQRYAPMLVQFTFGGLLSGMLIFYGRSGAWVESWPFLVIILGAIYFNETIKDRVGRFIYNLTIFFVGLFSYVVLVVPVLTGHMGPWVFVGSGLIALMCMYLFIQALFKIIPKFLELQMRVVVFTVGCVFFGFNFLYFANIIPPIPLSLKEVGIYHSVVKFDDTNVYQLTYEEGAWWQWWHDSNKVFHPIDNGSMFCFARVFAPTRLKTQIVHQFEYYNPEISAWEKTSSFAYDIAGGNSEGYRGFSSSINYTDGKWRCTVQTARGQVLGREVFTIDSTTPAGPLTTRMR